jgi:hypothetical protein
MEPSKQSVDFPASAVAPQFVPVLWYSRTPRGLAFGLPVTHAESGSLHAQVGT